MNNSFLRACCVALALTVALPGLGWAHAIVIASTPALDSRQKGPEVAVTVKFNSRIDHARSRLQLVDEANAVIDVTLDPNSPVDALVGKATGLKPGRHRIRWQVLAVDGHITRGDIPFIVTGP